MTQFEVALISGLILVVASAILSTAALPIAITICRSWVWLLTRGIEKQAGDRRRAEIESDLFEHRRDALEQGYAPHQVAVQVLLRWSLGLPGDLAWRASSAGTQLSILAAIGVALGGLIFASRDGAVVLLLVRISIALLAVALTGAISWTVIGNAGSGLSKRLRRQEAERSLDLLFLFAILGLLASGMIFLAIDGSPEDATLKRQIMYSMMGFVGLIFAMQLDYHLLRVLSVPLLLLVLTALLFVMAPVGSEVNGVRRWIEFGPLQMQPSEFLKLALLIYLAAWLSSRGSDVGQFSLGFVPLVILSSTATTLVLYEPDMGGALVIVLVSGVLFYSARAPITHLALFFLAGALMSIGFEFGGTRIGWSSPLGDSSAIANAVRGYTDAISGSSSSNSSLAGVERDGMFALIAQWGGPFAMTFIIGLYVLLVSRGFAISWRARNNFGRLLGVGITSWIGYQAILNVAGVVGLIPLTGQGLPFMTGALSDTFVISVAAGVLLSISRDRRSPRRQFAKVEVSRRAAHRLTLQ